MALLLNGPYTDVQRAEIADCLGDAGADHLPAIEKLVTHLTVYQWQRMAKSGKGNAPAELEGLADSADALKLALEAVTKRAQEFQISFRGMRNDAKSAVGFLSSVDCPVLQSVRQVAQIESDAVALLSLLDAVGDRIKNANPNKPGRGRRDKAVYQCTVAQLEAIYLRCHGGEESGIYDFLRACLEPLITAEKAAPEGHRLPRQEHRAIQAHDLNNGALQKAKAAGRKLLGQGAKPGKK